MHGSRNGTLGETPLQSSKSKEVEMDATVALLLTVVIGVGLIVGAVYLDKSNKRKAEDQARAALEAVLDPGEQLIEFTKVNTKGASAATVLLAGALGAAISRIGGTELYLGLTGRRMVLTPVKPAEDSRSVQVIPCEDIKSVDVVAGLYGSTSVTIHTRTGDVVVYVPGSQNWIRKATALKKAFAGK
jgi:hypothetical protein